MSGFSEAWLALREPVDHAARPPALVEWLRASLGPADVLEIVDLAAGSGSNLRWLAPRLGRPQRWELIDHDPVLLKAIPRQIGEWVDRSGYAMTVADTRLEVRGAGIEYDIMRRQLDLAGDSPALDFAGRHLVTTAALLDLVSDAWLRLLVERCRRAQCAVLFSLSYDGRIGFDPADPDDVRLVALVNRHQHTDKGFGPALGPEAWLCAVDLLGEAGLEVRVASSDWVIGADRHALLRELLAGWVAAAVELEPASGPGLSRWLERRLQQVESGSLHVRVGHQDIAAVPQSLPSNQEVSMAHVQTTIGPVPYAVTVRSGHHTLFVDEPEQRGGRDAGPAPYELLLASLGACTAITLRMYADRKQWAFESLTVELHHRREGDRSHIDRTITVVGNLTPEQLARMGEIAEKTPVTLTLRAGVEIHTRME